MNLDPIKTFFVQFKIYFFVAIGIVIMGQGFYIYTLNKDIERKNLKAFIRNL